jgi:glycosyltransferase involved in cell wall biosynthesis
MDLLYIVLTYNRPKVAAECFRTLFENTKIRPDECWILDDGSTGEFQRGLLQMAQASTSGRTAFNCILPGKNYGVAWNFEQAYNIMRYKNPKMVFFVESDYIFRNEWMEDVLAVFDAAPHTIAIPGVDHPDMYLRHKTHGEFVKLMVDQWGRDITARPYMYEPFDLDTARGKIKVFGVSNSCGCHILHWHRFEQILKDINGVNGFWEQMDIAFHKTGKDLDRQTASDAHISGTPTFLWEEWAIEKGIDITKNFAWLNIADASISQHLCAGGINGKIPGIQEGQTFVVSPTWPQDYNNWTRSKLDLV